MPRNHEKLHKQAEMTGNTCRGVRTADTHTPVTFDFEDEQRGKLFHFALRRENTRGDKGPFGPVENAVIP